VVGVSIETRARQAYHYLQQRRYYAPPKIRFGAGSAVPTVYYLARDYDEPSGGIRTLYRHVDILNDAGLPAAVLHRRPGFRCTWFPNQTRTTDVRSTRLGPADLLVVPETEANVLPTLPAGLKHVIFNQSGHLTWDRDPYRVSDHYLHNTDLLSIMVVSEHSRSLLRHAFDRPTHRIYLCVDPALFHPPDRPNGRVLSYMPRRGQADAENVLHILRGRGVLTDWSVAALDGLTQDEVALRLRRSTIFLSTPYQEGFGLPAAEAMACGNFVIGFHGFGGREFFDPESSNPVPAGDLLGMALAVERALAHERVDPGWCWTRGVQAAKRILTEYSPERERTSLLAFYETLARRPS
jgi:glycosyltransferase involved in cell wall biosynthesis